MLRCVQRLRRHFVPSDRHVQPMQPDCPPRRVLACSMTLTSREPSKETFDMYEARLGNRGFAASGSIGDCVEETLALLVRWYSAIMQTT